MGGLSMVDNAVTDMENDIAAAAASRQLFPAVEQLLGQTEYQEAVLSIAPKKALKGYVCLVDFLLCGLFHEWTAPCRKFYRRAGPSLSEVMSAQKAALVEAQLLIALEVAHYIHRDGLNVTWGHYRTMVYDTLMAVV